MPNTAPGTSPSPAAAAAHYRFRTESTVSPWMTADQLKEAALRGDLTPESEIQQSGHTEWVVASHVRGLTFPAPPGEEPPVPPADSAATPASRHPRFLTLRDLMAAYVNAEIEINLPDSTEFTAAHLSMVGSDHFEVTLESNRSRVFVPYSRIRVIWELETSASATLNYREAHKLSVELEKK